MTRLLFVFTILLAFTAAAQAQVPPAHKHDVEAMQMMYTRELKQHEADLSAAIDLQNQLTAQTKELEDLKKSSAPKPAKP